MAKNNKVMIMSKYEEIKLAILALDGVRNVIFGYSDKTRYNCLHFSKDDRSFNLINSSNNRYHLYNNWLEDYCVIDYSCYNPDDVIAVLEKLLNLLPQYDTDKMVDEMEALANAINLDYKYADDDDRYEMLASVLAERYINDNHLKDDNYGVLFLIVEHVCINAIIGFRPEERRQRRQREKRKQKKE